MQIGGWIASAVLALAVWAVSLLFVSLAISPFILLIVFGINLIPKKKKELKFKRGSREVVFILPSGAKQHKEIIIKGAAALNFELAKNQ